MELFKLLGKIAVDNSEANKALDDTSQKGEKTQSKLSKAFGAMGKGAVAVGKTVMTGLAVGGAAMGALTVKALNMSGELEQNMGGSEAVFKEYAGKIDIYKVNVDSEQELASLFRIRTVPTLVFAPMEGDPHITMGAPTKAQLRKALDSFITA